MPRTPARRASSRSRAAAAAPPRAAPASGGLSRISPRWVIVALVAINLVVFAPVSRFDFVSYDDPWYVTDNTNVTGGLTLRGLWWALTSGYFFYWHPATWVSHMIDVGLFGLWAGGHHLTNLLLHIASTLLLFGVLRRATCAVGRSALVAALFAVHPLHVESVAWVAERKDVLSTLLLMLTLRAYVAYVEERTSTRYMVVLLCFAAGLMAKPMLVTLPVILLLLDLWPLRRMVVHLGSRAPTPEVPVSQRAAATALLREKLPLFVLALAVAVATLLVQWRAGAVGTLTQLSLDYRLSNATLSYLRYLWMMVWPTGLTVFYPYPSALPPWWQIAGAAVLLVAVTVAAARAAGRRPYLIVGWLWYLVTLLPVIGLLQAGDQLMADRFTYVPLVGLFVIIAWGGAELVEDRPRLARAAAAVAVLAVAGCAAAASVQVRYWRNSETLWRRALAVTTANHRAHAALGAVLAERQQLDEAIAQYREALRILPAHAEWRNNLGQLYAQQDRVMEAMGQFAIATRVQPAFSEAHNNLGAMLARANRRKEAIVEYREAIRLRPDFALAHQNLALALAGEGRLDEALSACLESLRLDPSKPDWHLQAASTRSIQARLAPPGRFAVSPAGQDP